MWSHLFLRGGIFVITFYGVGILCILFCFVITNAKMYQKTRFFVGWLTIYQLVYAVKTVTYKEKYCKNTKEQQKKRGCEGHHRVWGSMYMYIYTEVVFWRGDKLSHVYKNPLDTALFPGITAEQEQVSLTFNVLT